MKYLDFNIKVIGRSIELRELLDELRRTYVHTYQTEAWKRLFVAAEDALCALEKSLLAQGHEAAKRESETLQRAVDSLPKDR
jgi:hypothetical protein